jgi:K+-sensing histidine kinase KdpD
MPNTNRTPEQWRAAARVGAVGVPIVVCAVLSTFREHVPAATSVLLLVLVVVAAAATGDRLAGLLAAVSASLAFDFFLTQPYARLNIADSDDVEAAILLVVISVAVGELALWGRRQEARASRRAGYLDGLLAAAEAVAQGSTDTAAVTNLVAGQITELLDVDKTDYVAGPLPDAHTTPILHHDGTVTRDSVPIDVDRTGLPTNDYVAVPVHEGPRIIGHFRFVAADHVSYPSQEQRRVAALLADQVAGVRSSPPA